MGKAAINPLVITRYNALITVTSDLALHRMHIYHTGDHGGTGGWYLEATRHAHTSPNIELHRLSQRLESPGWSWTWTFDKNAVLLSENQLRERESL